MLVVATLKGLPPQFDKHFLFAAEFCSTCDYSSRLSMNVSLLYDINRLETKQFLLFLCYKQLLCLWVGLQTLWWFRLKDLSIDVIVGAWYFGCLSGPPGFTSWISFAPLFSFIYCWVLSLFYLLVISWFICSRILDLYVPRRYFFCASFMFLFFLVFAMSLCASVYMCFVVTCWERADLLALVCGV